MLKPSVLFGVIVLAASMLSCGANGQQASGYTESRINQLERAVSDLRQRLDQLRQQNQRLQQEMDKMQSRMESRLQHLEKGPAAKAPVPKARTAKP